MIARAPNSSDAVGMIEDNHFGHDPDFCFDENVGQRVRTRRAAGVEFGAEPVSGVGGDNSSHDQENTSLASAHSEANRVRGDHG